MSEASKPTSGAVTCPHCSHENPSFFSVCAHCRLPVSDGSRSLSFARGFIGCWTVGVALIGGVGVIVLIAALILSDENRLAVAGFLAAWVFVAAFMLYAGRLGSRGLHPHRRRGDAGPAGDALRPDAARDAGPFRLSPESARDSESRPIFLWFIAFFWNGLSWTGLIAMLVATETKWWAFLFIAPFILVGLGLLVAAVRATLVRMRFRAGVMTVNQATFVPGDTVVFDYHQVLRRSATIDSCTVRLVCRETVTYQQGTTTRTETHDQVIEEVTLDTTSHMPRATLSGDGRLVIPKSAMHSFLAAKNKLEYFLGVTVAVPLWPDYKDDFCVVVLPSRIESRASHAQT